MLKALKTVCLEEHCQILEVDHLNLLLRQEGMPSQKYLWKIDYVYFVMDLTLKLKHIFYYIVIFKLISEEIFLAKLTNLICEYFSNMNDTEKMIFLMNDTHIINHVAKNLHTMFSRRKLHLQTFN